MKQTVGAQMNTNLNMLPVLRKLVHTLSKPIYGKNAQKFGKMLPDWAKFRGGLNWY